MNNTRKPTLFLTLGIFIMLSPALSCADTTKAKLEELQSRDITLRFKPPKYKTAFVTHKKLLQHNHVNVESTYVGTHKLSIKREDDRLRFNWSNINLSQFNYDTEKQPIESIRNYYVRTLSLKPSFVVSTDGEYLKSLNENELFDSAVSIGKSKFASDNNEAVIETFMGFMNAARDNSLSAEAVERFWYYLVTAWKGRELLHEITTLSEYSQAEPLFSNFKLPRKSLFTNMGTVPCGGLDEILYCVELELRDHVDSDKYKEALKPYLKEHNAQTGEELEIINFQNDYTVSVITLPESLTPYYLHVSHIFAARYITNGEQKDVYLFNRDQYTFTYIE